ncbi:unnamed protein product [Rhizoctonia solani]|uniref:PNPLA domain-containing protein n=1 Tax=Rhizoctonia solani TaxID=456999 RepID=A0A8H3DYH9_9AGAM|nr:unnamed protein product [Rhizoctonia solani]
MSHEQENRGLNLLSLDGGETKGLSSLLIIRELMHRLRGTIGMIPEPWQYFDLIAGSGTGAISAIMLGRLHMSIDDAISAYNKLMSSVFSDKKVLTNGPAAYSATKLEQELKEIVRKATGDENERMIEEPTDQVKCRVVIYAMSPHNVNANLPCAFRTYSSSAHNMPNCRIWEALRASTAHPDLFKSIEILDHDLRISQPYIGGGIGNSNPTADLLKEVTIAYPDQAVASITSIGAGHMDTIRLSGHQTYGHGRTTHQSVLNLTHALAMDTQRVAQNMANYFSGTSGLYYRLDVGQGMQGIEPTDSSKQSEIASHTYAYMFDPEVDHRLNDLAKTIRERPNNFDTTYIGGRMILTSKLPPTTFTKLPPPTYFFTGREPEVDKVCRYFDDPQVPQVFVLHGMGGAGKTQTALKALERIAPNYEGVLFIDGSSRAKIEATLSQFAVSKYAGATHMDALKWVSNREGRWIFLFDNVDDPKIFLPEYFPWDSKCSVLITTRYRVFARLAKGGSADCNISEMNSADAHRLLLTTSGLKPDELPDLETEIANQLLQELGYLPLAIALCGAYICHTNCSISQYYEMYRKDPRELLQGDESNPLRIKDYEIPLYKTWELSFAMTGAYSRRLMQLVAFLHRNSISAEIFRRASVNLSIYSPLIPPTKPQQAVYDNLRDIFNTFNIQGVWTPSRFLSAMGELVSLSLVTFDHVDNCYHVHPLVQQWARSISPRMIGCAAALLAVSIDRDFSAESCAYRRKIIPHINEILGFCPFMSSSNVSEVSRDLLSRCGSTVPINNAWQYVEAYSDAEQLSRMERLEQLVYQTCKLEFGEDDPKTLECIRYLAGTYISRGNLKEAEKLHHQVLDIRRRTLGDNHRDTLWSMTGLAETYYYQRRYADAEPIFKESFTRWEQIAGKTNPMTLKVGADWALTLQALGRLKEAESLELDIRAARSALLGNNHPDTLQSMANLAATYMKMGLLDQAAKLGGQVLDLRTKTLGDEHPATQRSKGELAVVLCEQGRLSEAGELVREVLEFRQKLLGKEHPETLQSMADLAAIYNQQGRLTEAEAMEMEVLALRTGMLGDEHLEILETKANLATLYYRQERFKDAERLGIQVLLARKRLLGDEHPDTLRSMINLAATYYNQDCSRLEEAEKLCAFVVDVRIRDLGDSHHDTVSSVRHLERIRTLQERERRSRDMALKAEMSSPPGPIAGLPDYCPKPIHVVSVLFLLSLIVLLLAWFTALMLPIHVSM